jgi:hypothetical protein
LSDFSDSLYAQNAFIIFQEKGVAHLAYYSMLYKHVHAFLKVNKFFTRLTIMLDAQDVFLLPLNNSIIKNIGPTIHAAVMTHHTKIFILANGFLMP